MDRLTFHQVTLDLLGREPKIDPAAVAMLDKREAALGVRIPASVREWYSIEGAAGVLAKHSNGDRPLPIANVGAQPWDGLLSAGLLVFMDENQGVHQWGVRLDGGDDPPVLWGYYKDLTKWDVVTDKFSTFVYCYVWDWGRARREDCHVYMQKPVDLESYLPRLRQHFRAGPQSTYYSNVFYRFERVDGSQRVLTEGQPDSPWTAQCWDLSADDADALEGMLRLFWEWGMFRGEVEFPVDLDECSELVLERLHRAIGWPEDPPGGDHGGSHDGYVVVL